MGGKEVAKWRGNIVKGKKKAYQMADNHILCINAEQILNQTSLLIFVRVLQRSKLEGKRREMGGKEEAKWRENREKGGKVRSPEGRQAPSLVFLGAADCH